MYAYINFPLMFKRLKEKWGVNWLRFTLIFCTFAVGGSLCGYFGRAILDAAGLHKNLVYYVIYVPLITLLWPLCVLAVSIPLGQFSFFLNYITRLVRKISGRK